MNKKVIFFGTIIKFLSFSQAQAFGLDSISQQMLELIQTEKKQSLPQMCNPGGVCRGWGGLACYDPALFSSCWLLCHEWPGFATSSCVKKNAKEKLSFSVDQEAFIKNNKKQTPLAYLQEAIYNPHKTPLEKILLCDTICHAVNVPKNGELFFGTLSAGLLKAACTIGCK